MLYLLFHLSLLPYICPSFLHSWPLYGYLCSVMTYKSYSIMKYEGMKYSIITEMWCIKKQYNVKILIHHKAEGFSLLQKRISSVSLSCFFVRRNNWIVGANFFWYAPFMLCSVLGALLHSVLCIASLFVTVFNSQSMLYVFRNMERKTSLLFLRC